jgi:hypothetical protein
MNFPIERCHSRSHAIHCAVLALVVCGCSSGASSGAGAKANVFFTDANNYSSTSSLTLPTIMTPSGADFMICWDQIMKDLQCHSVTPLTDIDSVTVLEISNPDAGAIESLLANGSIDSEVHAPYQYLSDHTSACAKLSQFSFAGVSINVGSDYLPDPTMQWMVLFATGTQPGYGSRTMAFLDPTSSSSASMIEAPDGCGILDFTANLTSLTKLSIPAKGPWVIDWSGVTKDSAGNDAILPKLDSLLLGYYPGMQPSDLQAQFFNIQQIANPLYQMTFNGASSTSADLANAKDSNGTAFSGFTSTSGTWAVGLLCSSCQNPAPVALTILNPQ